MTDRVKGCWVSFKDDTRTDDIESTVDAIRQLRKVSAVETVVTDTDDWFARDRVRHEVYSEIIAAMREVLGL